MKITEIRYGERYYYRTINTNKETIFRKVWIKEIFDKIVKVEAIKDNGSFEYLLVNPKNLIQI